MAKTAQEIVQDAIELMTEQCDNQLYRSIKRRRGVLDIRDGLRNKADTRQERVMSSIQDRLAGKRAEQSLAESDRALLGIKTAEEVKAAKAAKAAEEVKAAKVIKASGKAVKVIKSSGKSTAPNTAATAPNG